MIESQNIEGQRRQSRAVPFQINNQGSEDVRRNINFSEIDPLHTKLISDTKRLDNFEEATSPNKSKENLIMNTEEAINNQGHSGEVVSIVMGVNKEEN